MDPRFPVSREEFHGVQMDVKQLHTIQNNHHDRLLRLEKRQADDAAIKSVWNSPFPSVLGGGTPQHGPMQTPNDMFDDFDEQGQTLLGSLHLGPAEDEPTRRGAASRANSVRFDESALQGSTNWGQSTRHSGEFGPARPSSGFGSHPMMERSLSHKSDGRHSSAGHSVYSHHSVASTRGSSLGLDVLSGARDDDSPIEAPEPPPGFTFMGSVPSIVRCWMSENFAHDTLLYAVVCTGSQKSVLDYSLVRELDLASEVHRDVDGVPRLRLPVYLAEAMVTHGSSRASSPAPPMPCLMATFEVVGMDISEDQEMKKGIRIYIGSETLREHSADILFSQNLMTLYGCEREKLSVPFVRPEDNSTFRNIRTLNLLPEKTKLNASARPFVVGDVGSQSAEIGARGTPEVRNQVEDQREIHELVASPTAVDQAFRREQAVGASNPSESGGESERFDKESSGIEARLKDHVSSSAAATGARNERRDSSSSIWTSWRHGSSANGNDTQKENGLLSGYQPAPRGRSMKILKTAKSTSSSSARTGAAYETPPPPRTSGEHRRKEKTMTASESGATGTVRWETAKRQTSTSTDKSSGRDARSASGTVRTSSNPVGGASAFSWMNPSNKPKPPTTAAE